MNNFQQTIKRENSISGIGLHNGENCQVIVKPVTHGGITFYRKDFKTPFAIKASYCYKTSSQYHTVLEKNGVQLATIEHFLSALFALQIDNLVVELDNSELPILDGSAQPWIEFFEDCGIQELPIKKKIFHVKKETKVGNKHNYAIFRPAEKLNFRFLIEFRHPMIQKQYYKFEMNLENYKKEIAPCRTFGFEEDITMMKEKGLIKGGTLDNAIVLSKDGTMLNQKKLLFKDEFVRHKILDAIGDIYLGGINIIGDYYGHKASHKLNVELVQKLFSI